MSLLQRAYELPVSGVLGVALYWVPASICAVGYSLRTFANYQKDLADRANFSDYRPTDTVGSLIGRAVVTVIPVANIWAAAFDVSPKMFGKFFGFLDRVFNQPLVPKRRSV